jgi:hypothetical protein
VAPPGGRATLRPGYNVVAAEGAALRRLLEALLYPDARDADAIPRATGGPANAPVRAGLTLVGNDRITYRLVRDFAAGAQLHRFDAEKRSFALVSQDLAQISAFFQKTVGVPPTARLSALLAISAADLPSKASGGGTSVLPPPSRTALTPEQAKRKLGQLAVELERARIAEKVQYEIDGNQARLFKLEESLKTGAKLREALDKAESARAELEPAAQVAGGLGDPDAKLAAYDRASAKREEAEAKVAAEREGLADAEQRGAPTPFWKAPLFWAGAGGGLALALGAAAGATVFADLRYLAILDVPAFGFAAWVALRWVGGIEEWDRLSRRRRIIDDWERKIAAQHQKDVGEVGEAVKALGLSKISELKDALARVAAADAAVAECRTSYEAWEASPEAQSALGEKAKVEEALRSAETKLQAEAGGFVRDVRSVEAEIRRLQQEAAAPAAAPAPVTPVAPVRTAGEPLRTLLERAAAELGGSPTAAARGVAQKASQALSGLSFQRLQAVVVDDRGNVQVQTGGRSVAALTLPLADRDLVWLSLKLAFVEQALAAGKVVAVSEDAFAGLSEGARRFAARLLKQIAKPGQLLHATTDPSFREAADHAA